MGKVNLDYVIGIVQKNNRLEIVREELPSSSLLLKELHDMIANDNKTVMDMQNHYNLNIKAKCKSFDYLLPLCYSSSYVASTREPNITLEKYQVDLNTRIAQMTTGTNEEKKNSANRAMKQNLYSDYVYFLHCYNYYLAYKKIEENYDWKMISSEWIGWTNYEYPIDKDFIVYLSTNFGYGCSSYFNLTVEYKDILIVPYTYLIKYYKANMVQICNCTRAYTVDRDNWEVAFDFVKDFVNHGKENPTSFAKKYIMNEVNELVSGLVRIMQSPEAEVQQKIQDMDTNSLEHNSLTFVSHIPNLDIQYFEINHKEFGVVYKSEKISSGLDVLNSLKSLCSILPEVEASIEKIKSLNHLLIPEISELSDSITREIESLNEEIENYKNQIDILEKEKEVFSTQCLQEWEIIRKEDPKKSRYTFEKEFMSNHPQYPDLMNEIYELKKKKDDVESKRYKRSAIRDRLNRCLTKINDYFAKAA